MDPYVFCERLHGYCACKKAGIEPCPSVVARAESDAPPPPKFVFTPAPTLDEVIRSKYSFVTPPQPQPKETLETPLAALAGFIAGFALATAIWFL